MITRKKITLAIREIFIDALKKIFGIDFYLEIFNQETSQCLGRLPLSLSKDWRFTSFGPWIRIDSPNGQMIVFINEEFMIDDSRHRINRKWQWGTKASVKSILPEKTFIQSKKFVFGVIAFTAALIATVFMQIRARILPRADQSQLEIAQISAGNEQSKQVVQGTFSDDFENQIVGSRNGSETHAETSSTDKEKPAGLEKSGKNAKKVRAHNNHKHGDLDPIHCAPIRHISRSRLLDKFESQTPNRRHWYVCR